MAITNTVVNKVFDDLDTYRDYCRFEGKVFNEAALYNRNDPNWQAYEKYRNYLRTKSKYGNNGNNKRFERRPQQ